MTTTTAKVAMGGAMLKDDETRTLLQAAVMAMAPLNVSSAPPPLRVKRKARISRNLLRKIKFLFSVNIIQ